MVQKIQQTRCSLDFGRFRLVTIVVTLNSVYNDCVYNDIPVIPIEFHGPGHDANIYYILASWPGP